MPGAVTKSGTYMFKIRNPIDLPLPISQMHELISSLPRHNLWRQQPNFLHVPIHRPANKLILSRLHQLVDVVDRHQSLIIIPAPQQRIVSSDQLDFLTMGNLLGCEIRRNLMSGLALDLGGNGIDRVVEEVFHLVVLWLRLILNITFLADSVVGVREDRSVSCVPFRSIFVASLVEYLLDRLLHGSTKAMLLIAVVALLVGSVRVGIFQMASWLLRDWRLPLTSWWLWEWFLEVLLQNLDIASWVDPRAVEANVLWANLSKLVAILVHLVSLQAHFSWSAM